MATGFHGFHVHHRHDLPRRLPVRARAGHFTPDHHFGFEAAAWYWHFVDVVWLFLFICIYWWGGGSGRRRMSRWPPVAMSSPDRPAPSTLATALLCRCPRCGRGKLYDGLHRAWRRAAWYANSICAALEPTLKWSALARFSGPVCLRRRRIPGAARPRHLAGRAPVLETGADRRAPCRGDARRPSICRRRSKRRARSNIHRVRVDRPLRSTTASSFSAPPRPMARPAIT